MIEIPPHDSQYIVKMITQVINFERNCAKTYLKKLPPKSESPFLQMLICMCAVRIPFSNPGRSLIFAKVGEDGDHMEPVKMADVLFELRFERCYALSSRFPTFPPLPLGLRPISRAKISWRVLLSCASHEESFSLSHSTMLECGRERGVFVFW